MYSEGKKKFISIILEKKILLFEPESLQEITSKYIARSKKKDRNSFNLEHVTEQGKLLLKELKECYVKDCTLLTNDSICNKHKKESIVQKLRNNYNV